jgi:hypothetical protein
VTNPSKLFVRAARARIAFVAFAIFAAFGALVGCSDTGDNTSLPLADSGGGDTTTAEDANPTPDAAADSSSLDAAADSTTVLLDAASDANTAHDGSIDGATDATIDGGADAASDATVDATVDAGVDAAHDASVDAAVDAEAADAEALDAAEEPPNDGGCAAHNYQCQCDHYIAANQAGNTVATTCAATEVVLFEKDTSGGCLACALNKSCIDDDIGTGDTAQECDDLASATAAPSIATVLGATGVDQCLATLACEVGVDSATGAASTAPLNVGSTRTLANSYCGSAAALTCQNGSPAGACVGPIAAGLPGIPAGSSTLSHIGDQTYPSGQAGTILACLLRSTGGQCTTCLN